MASAGRFSPRGPLGTSDDLLIVLADRAGSGFLYEVASGRQCASDLGRVGGDIDQPKALGDALVANGFGLMLRDEIVDALGN